MAYKSRSTITSTMRTFIVALLLTVAFPFYGIAQNVISGIVSDETGEPLIGVSVEIKGANGGVTTDVKGLYTINAKRGDVIVFSYVGMTPETVKVGAEKPST